MSAATAPAARRELQSRPLVAGCLIGVAISWNIANVGPVATLLARTYGTTLTVIGLFTTVLFFAELAVMVPGGRAIDRYGAKRVGLVAIALSLIANAALMLATGRPLATTWRPMVSSLVLPERIVALLISSLGL